MHTAMKSRLHHNLMGMLLNRNLGLIGMLDWMTQIPYLYTFAPLGGFYEAKMKDRE